MRNISVDFPSEQDTMNSPLKQWLGFAAALSIPFCGSALYAQGTAFTYQGRLNQDSFPVRGLYDFRFELYDTLPGGTAVAGPITNAAVVVSDGLFTTALDFGQMAFDGNPRFLEIAVRTNGGGAFVAMAPRQNLTAAPYALVSGDATSLNLARLAVPNTAVPATGVPTVTSGFVTGATVTRGGSGYLSPPPVSVSDSTGSGASITANVAGGSVVSLTVNNAGSGYSPAATLSIAPPSPNNFQVFITSNYFPNVNIFTNTANRFAGTYEGDGAGLRNLAAWGLQGNAGTSAGSNFLGTTDNQALEVRVNGQRVLRLEPGADGSPNMIGGALLNEVGPGIKGATIAGGGITNFFGGPFINQVLANWGTIGGGYLNTVGTNADLGTIAGGDYNEISTGADRSAIGGGLRNMVLGSYGTVGGGTRNSAGSYATVAGGSGNSATGMSATVPGGAGNSAAGSWSFAAGTHAAANHQGAFVWADSTAGSFGSQRDDQLRARANGGVRFDVNSNNWVEVFTRATGLPPFVFYRLIDTSTGAYLSSGGVWTDSSDRNRKTGFAPVDAQQILSEVASLRIQTWSFTNETQVRHIGPVAQDFYAAFGVGADETSLAPLDEAGVALAAVQALNERLEARLGGLESELQRREGECAELQRQTALLETRLRAIEKAFPLLRDKEERHVAVQ